MEFSVKDSFRTAIELASGGKNTVIYDNQGNPNIMVCIPKFDKSLLGLSAGIHGAFVLDDNHVAGEIWVSKYANGMGSGGVPVSMHGLYPEIEFGRFYHAKDLIKSKGSGWHIMSNIEWGAIAALSIKQGTEPYGFTYKCNNFKKYLCTKHKPFGSDETGWVNGQIAWNVMAGHSLNEFSHDGTADGIFDMVGNQWEMVDGLRIVGIGKGYTKYFGENGVPQNRFRDEKWTSGVWYLGHDGEGLCVDTCDGVRYADGTICRTDFESIRFFNGADKYKDALVELAISPPCETKYGTLCKINTSYTKDEENHDCCVMRGGAAYYMDANKYDYSLYSMDLLSYTETNVDFGPINKMFPIKGVRACYISDLY